MRIFALFLTSMILISCTTLQRKPANQGRHIVVLIHGIGSDTKKTFGNMPAYLMAREGVEAIVFDYDTLSKTKNVYDFAKDLSLFLRNYTRISPLHDGDEISLVMHSQGGLVGFTWLENSFNGSPDYAPEMAPYIKRFITLGTPMWGSKMARAGDVVNNAVPIDKTGLAGNQQLMDMTYGSDLFRIRRNYLIGNDRKMLRNKIDAQVKFMHVAGWAKAFKPLGLLTDGIGYESDTTVPIASTRYEHVYAISKLKNYPDNHVLAPSAFQMTETHPYRLVEGWHIPGVMRNTGVGIAYTPDDCLQSTCDHEPTRIVQDFLNDKNIHQTQPMESELTGFIVELRVELPENSKVTKKDVDVEFDANRSKLSTLFKDEALSIADPFEIMSKSGRRAYTPQGKTESILRYYFTGVSRTKDGVSQTVRMKIEAPGYKTRYADLPVRAGFTTYLEMNLEPK